MSHDVFISYSTKDKHAADAVCAVLERNNIRCWIAPRDVLPGITWGSAIVAAIHDAKVIVLVFSGHANTSPQIEREVERAISHGLAVIPFRIEDIKPSHSLEYFISASHWLDAFTEPMEQHLETLAKVVRHIIELKQGKEDAVGAIVETASEREEKRRAAAPGSMLPSTPARPGMKPWVFIAAGIALGAVAVMAVLLYESQLRKAQSQTVAIAAPAAQPAPSTQPAATAQPTPPTPATPPTSAAPPPSVQPAATPAPPMSISGQWNWDALCSGTHWIGKFNINDTAPGHFEGVFDETV